jgi:hypothetical protein
VTTIGSMNGKWAFMARAALATWPFVLAWCVWQTSQQFADLAFREAGGRYTEIDAQRDRESLMMEIRLAVEEGRQPIREAIARQNADYRVEITRVASKVDALTEASIRNSESVAQLASVIERMRDEGKTPP